MQNSGLSITVSDHVLQKKYHSCKFFLIFNLKFAYDENTAKAKLIARWGRKATDLRKREIAGLPGIESVTRFFLFSLKGMAKNPLPLTLIKRLWKLLT
jgi:hypothetical protein